MLKSRLLILLICLQVYICTQITTVAGQSVVSPIPESNTVFVAPKNGFKNQTTADLVAFSALNFAHNVGLLLNEDMHLGQTTIFSPVSIMSSMVLLMLGSKGRSFEDLRHIFRLDTPPLSDNFNAFHAEFGAMLQEMQDNAITLQSRNRDNWRNTNVAYSIRNKPKVKVENGTNALNLIKIVNGLFVKNGYELNPTYRDVINAIYKCDVMPLDFKLPFARDYINDWVYKNTFGKISGILTDQIPADTNAIITSALYFKGFWDNPFLQGATVIDNFYPDGVLNEPIKVQMMATAGPYPYYYSPEDDCRIIGLPYVHNYTSMYVIQPLNSSRTSLRRLLKTLSAEKIEDMIAKMVYQNAIFALPKMHFTQNINMKKIFRALGIADIFPSAVRNDFPPANTHISDLAQRTWPRVKHNIVFPTEANANLFQKSPATPAELLRFWSFNRNVSENLLSDLFVGDIVHKVDFVVDENGTEGAAATATYLKRSGGNVLFRADTPFLLLVRHDPTKLPLFYGIINLPAPSFI
ncbi:serine protease inhibitor 28Dc [Ceratitis capitata]|uniref:serine protease inhibitor 28Dc n=1 Tax=Ceratitis capitata TaxID=7213 RepID=UPI000329C05C|nr:serine protease inhibitor 28Dc [Ceratitis capitata]